MKKIRDISQNIHASEVDVSDDSVSQSPEVETHPETRLISDIFSGKKTDISLGKKTQIRLQKKKGKNFDALEKSSLFSRISKKQNLKIKRETQNFYLGRYMLLIKRYVKKLGFLGKSALMFLVILGVILLGYTDKIVVERKVNSGYEKLLSVKQGHINLHEIQKQVNDARFDLLIADVLFTPFSLFSGDKIDSVESVISGGRYLSKALDDTLALYMKTDAFIAEKSLHRIYFTQLFLNIYPELQNIESALLESIKKYKSISWLPHEDLYAQRDEAVKQIDKLGYYLTKINQSFPEFLDVFGHSQRRRYLIVFQNADEIRPNGGFMGSMGLVEIYKGRIQLFQKKDVYAIEWDLKKSDYERLLAPKGLNELTENFGLRDANYYLNLKDSSNAIKFFTDNAGIQLDGIIYINQNILLHLLEITGPVYFDVIGKEISSENFSEIMSLLVEAKTFKSGTLGTPKQVLFDFMEVFSEKLMNDAQYFNYLQSLIHDIESRDIMMWSFHEQENKFLRDVGVNGAIDYDTTFDFVYPVYTSLSGNKSDRYIKRSYRQEVTSGENCSYDVNLMIESTHNMGKRKRENIQALIDEYDLDSPNLLEIQGAARNRQFVRVILPSDAEIVPKEGMEIIDYGLRQGVEFFLDTQLQETSYYDISYSLPNTLCKNYDFTFYKQSGIPSYDIEMSIDGENYQYFQRKEDFYFEKRK